MSLRTWWFLAIAGTLGTGLLGLALRAPLPVDETRYLTVAWEMWSSGHFAVPTLNGEPYDHKPPLLFWLIHLGWALGGVGDAWPRLLAPLGLLVAMLGLRRLGVQLWPDHPQAGALAGLMLMATWFVALFQTVVMFDLPLLACVAWGWVAVVGIARNGRLRDWLLFGACVGIGSLTKGPVVLVYLLPALLAMRCLGTCAVVRPAHVFAGLAVALLLPACWLAAVAVEAGVDFLARVVVDQASRRISGEMGHPRPFYWYLPWLAVLPLPWLLWRPFLQAFLHLPRDGAVRLVGIVAVSGLLVLSVVAGKQAHYLLPLLALALLVAAVGLSNLPVSARPPGVVLVIALSPLPIAALVLAAGHLGHMPWMPSLPWPWMVALSVLAAGLAHWRAPRSAMRAATILVAVFAGHAALALSFGLAAVDGRHDIEGAARFVREQQLRGRPVAMAGNYEGELGFSGRLEHTITEIAAADVPAWWRRHPHGLVVMRERWRGAAIGGVEEYSQPYRSSRLLILGAPTAVARATAQP